MLIVFPFLLVWSLFVLELASRPNYEDDFWDPSSPRVILSRDPGWGMIQSSNHPASLWFSILLLKGQNHNQTLFWRKNSMRSTGPISMSLGIFESTMAYLEMIFEFFDFDDSKPLFQLQNEVVSTIPWQNDDKAMNQSFVRHCVSELMRIFTLSTSKNGE